MLIAPVSMLVAPRAPPWAPAGALASNPLMLSMAALPVSYRLKHARLTARSARTATIVASASSEESLEDQRQAVESFVQDMKPQDAAVDAATADGAGAQAGFNFASSSTRSPALVDDLAQGAEALRDVASRSSGIVLLLADICIGGLTSPVGLAFFALFAALFASGEFGTPVRFIATAPTASEGTYYEWRGGDGTPAMESTPTLDD